MNEYLIFIFLILPLLITAATKKKKPTPIDVCKLPKDEGKRCLFKRKRNRWYYDFRAKVCKEFKYKGCKGNLNRFDNEYKCLTTCKGR
ncbi:hypothetical protein ACQ4LE_010210 [Meloidogyne hapla]